jgi:sugar phosphate isomerase/epimerase
MAAMRLSVITDEVDPDFEVALRVCESLDVSGAEVRTIGGRNIVHHPPETVRRVRNALSAGGFSCPVVDTPFLKTRIEETAWADLDRGIEIADTLGAGIVRLFSGLRLPQPETALPWLADTLAESSRRAADAGLTIALEIEFVCNVALAAEARELLHRLPPDTVGLVWDPGNEARFLAARPDPAELKTVHEAVHHVHVKDFKDDWVRVGAGIVDWDAQLQALIEIGYQGYLSMETHYATPDGGPAGATRDSVAALRELAARRGVDL